VLRVCQDAQGIEVQGSRAVAWHTAQGTFPSLGTEAKGRECQAQEGTAVQAGIDAGM